jgi:hypothetical protein
MNSINIIIIILVIIAVLSIYSIVVEGYNCNCVGMSWKTAKPTYYVYRPTGDVSNYGDDYVSQMAESQFMTIGSQPIIYPKQQLGWRTGMPYDYFSNYMSNNWAAGSDLNPAVNSSVPFLARQELNAAASNISPENNGGYKQNYGSPGGLNSNNMMMMTPFAEGLKFVNGPAGYPNMLSDGTPQYEGPAGSFSNSPGYANACPSVNAYNLNVGVL